MCLKCDKKKLRSTIFDLIICSYRKNRLDKIQCFFVLKAGRVTSINFSF